MLVNQVKLYLYLIVGFHQKWNSSVDRRHPSLWIFIRKMKGEQSNIEVFGLQLHRMVIWLPQKAQVQANGKKDQTTSAAIPQRDKNIGRILVRNYICCKNICVRFWWLHVLVHDRNTCINWCVGLHSSSYCPCMLHYPWQYKDFSLKLHIKDFVEISRTSSTILTEKTTFWSILHLFKITHQIYKT